MTGQNDARADVARIYGDAAAERWLHDQKADERREHARKTAIAQERWPYAHADWWAHVARNGDPRGNEAYVA